MARENPALTAFLQEFGESIVFAQVLIRRIGPALELRHVADKEISASDLKVFPPANCRSVAQHTSAGAFRPLKSAPSLIRGWLVTARDTEEFELALNQLYPGALADWFAARDQVPPVTSYRAFTARQTGMYRLTTFLNDVQVGEVIAGCCSASVCLKRRLWTVEGTPIDDPAAKSLIPCLEPCAVLLEFARKRARMEQEDRLPLQLGASEAATILEALQLVQSAPPAGIPEGDSSVPLNPRRLLMLREKLKRALPPE
jgi:hypothetical protein